MSSNGRKRSAFSHPIQPTYKDENGVIRFRCNHIVRFLLDAGKFDMNSLAVMPFSAEDREQFAQLIGYSVSGFGDLSYVNDQTFFDAENQPTARRPKGWGRH